MKNRFFFIIVSFIGCFPVISNAQPDWNTNGNTIGGTQWFGATSTSTDDLTIEHRADDYPILFSTTTNLTTTERMRIYHDPVIESVNPQIIFN